jgi:20S proteasome alpha/beta subunit
VIIRSVTLLVALLGSDGVVLAADSRGTFGDPSQTTAQNDSQKKAHILAPHVAAITSGNGEVAALLAYEAKRAMEDVGLDGVTPVMEMLRETCREKFNEWFPTVPAIQAPALAAMGQAPTRPVVNFVVGGYELGANGPHDPKLFHLLSHMDFAPMLSDYGWAVEGIAQYALYLLNRLYQQDRGVQELTALATYTITETASQDGKVGGPVKVITITPTKGCVLLDEEAIGGIMSQNAARSAALQNSFYESGEA